MNRELRQPVIAGNWKMNNGIGAAAVLLDQLKESCPAHPACEVVVCVPYLDIPLAAASLADSWE